MMSADDILRGVVESRSSLIAAETLKALLGGPSVKVFDVRGTWKTPPRALPEEYAAGHIPGAVFLDWTKHFAEQDVAIGLASITDEAGARSAFEALGIDQGDLVVLYDDNSHMQAGRMWLAIRHWGFDNIRVLNGGWSYWQSQNLPVSKDTPEPRKGTFAPTKQDGLKVDLDAFLETHIQSCVIDARGPVGYAGDPDDPRTGHIPGALNVPFSSVLDPETGLFLDPDAIAQVLDDNAPHWRDTPIITSCGAGYAATVILLALHEQEIKAKLFDGSFSVWKQDANRPIVQSVHQ